MAGALFVVLSLAVSLTNIQPPAYNAEQAQIASWFADEGDRYRIGHVAAGLAFLLFWFPFFTGLYARLRDAEGKPAIWSQVMWAGAIISPVAGTAAGTCIMAAALLEDGVSPDVAAFALTAFVYAYTVSGAYSGVAMIGAAVVIIRTSVLPRWLGWTAAVSGVAAITGTVALVEDDPAGLFATISRLAWLAFFLWILAVSVALMRVRQVPQAEPGF
jgi:hypothetical protein